MVDIHSVHDFMVEVWIDPNGELSNGTRDIGIEELINRFDDSNSSSVTFNRNTRIPYE